MATICSASGSRSCGSPTSKPISWPPCVTCWANLPLHLSERPKLFPGIDRRQRQLPRAIVVSRKSAPARAVDPRCHEGRSLTGIKRGARIMDDAAQMPGVQPVKQVDKLVSERPTLRFAVGIFDTWADVQATVRDLTVGRSCTATSTASGPAAAASAKASSAWCRPAEPRDHRRRHPRQRAGGAHADQPLRRPPAVLPARDHQRPLGRAHAALDAGAPGPAPAAQRWSRCSRRTSASC